VTKYNNPDEIQPVGVDDVVTNTSCYVFNTLRSTAV